MKRFKRGMVADFRTMLLGYVRSQAEFHRQCEETWSSLLPHIEAIPSDQSQ